MKLKIGFAVVTLSLSLTYLDRVVAGPLPVDGDRFIRIINGDEVERGAYPFMASLQSEFYDGHFCGASLVHENYVLTAGHCTDGMDVDDFYVVLGMHDRSDLSEGEVFEVDEIISHPNYDGNVDFDFSLLKLRRAVDTARFPVLEYTREEIEIPASSFINGIMSTTMGWGTTENNRLSEVLMQVDVPLVSQQRCEAAYPYGLTDAMICAGYDEGGKDSCQGDSGGPLIIRHNGIPLLVGTVSWGYGCALPGKYGVYGKVSVAAEWIEQVLSR